MLKPGLSTAQRVEKVDEGWDEPALSRLGKRNYSVE